MKVYLAKSNNSSFDDVSLIREVFKKNNIEVLEHNGGNYTHDKLNECDYLFIVPDLSNFDYFSYDIYGDIIQIGKGLYDQIESFIKRDKKHNIYFLLNVQEVDEDEDGSHYQIVVSKFNGYSDDINIKNYKYFTSIEIGETLTFNEFLGEITRVGVGEIPKVGLGGLKIENSNNSRYLLLVK